MSEDLRDNIRQAIANAFDDGCRAVHENYQEDRDPDFTEAASDYASDAISVFDMMQPAALTSSQDGWLAFESAPKDGSYILAVVAPGRGRHLEYHAGRVFVIRYEGLTRTDHMGWAVYPGFGGASDHDFAYWQPIFPPPPVKEMGL